MVIVVFRAMKSKVIASARRTCLPDLMNLLSFERKININCWTLIKQ